MQGLMYHSTNNNTTLSRKSTALVLITKDSNQKIIKKHKETKPTTDLLEIKTRQLKGTHEDGK